MVTNEEEEKDNPVNALMVGNEEEEEVNLTDVTLVYWFINRCLRIFSQM